MERSLIKAELTFQQEDGSVLVRTLEGQSVEQWFKWIESVCAVARIHGMSPDWASLVWKRDVIEGEVVG
jgi:hypothetical protein